MICWFDHSTKKIFKNAAPPVVPEGAGPEYSVYIAGNEYGACHLCVRNGGEEDDGAVSVSLGNIFREGGIPAGGDIDVRIFAERYVSVTMSGPFVIVPEEQEDAAAYYPDELSPVSGSVSVAAGETQPFYILISANRSAVPGNYTAEINVSAAGGAVYTALLKIRLWAFSLPETPSLTAVSGIDTESIKKITGLEGGDAERAYINYYKLLLEHGISAYSLPYDVLDGRADRYMSDKRVTGFRVDYRDDEYAAKAARKLRSDPEWLKKAYFYFLDEPLDEGMYEELVRRSRRLLEIFPEARIVSPFFVDPEMSDGRDGLEYSFGSVNIWCPKLSAFDTKNIYNEKQQKELEPLKDRLARRRGLGEDVWTYVCWEPGEPYLNLYVNMEGIRHRLIPWQMYMLGVNGFLYWSSNYWHYVDDPRTDMATVKWLSGKVYGDGSLIYGGRGTAEAASSLRLEQLRSGFADFEYLKLIETLSGPAEAASCAGVMVKGLTDYVTDDGELFRLKASMGERIEKLFLSGNRDE